MNTQLHIIINEHKKLNGASAEPIKAAASEMRPSYNEMIEILAIYYLVDKNQVVRWLNER